MQRKQKFSHDPISELVNLKLLKISHLIKTSRAQCIKSFSTTALLNKEFSFV
ncbi:hypothetical protein SBDP1_800019 [Syntrophobacter sp. SbD1]|nr:hypothetical protein SBDP1_800019 [Syntrophobacter sp. SbD1]